MSGPKPLTDSIALTQRRARTQADAMFLHAAVADDLQDRADMVNRTFNSAAVVSGFPNLWRKLMPNAHSVADKDVLELGVGAHDLVIHTLALHWANDPVGQIIQCKRSLQKDGLFLAATFGGQTLHELRACLGQAEIETSGGLSPRIAPMGELRDLGGLLQRAGFALPVADVLPLTVNYRDLWHLMHDLRHMGEANALQERLRFPTHRRVFERAAELYAQTYPTPEGGIAATFEIVMLTGWAPDESQPKPLRPGSAEARLADALGTDENRLPD
ncbi:MULTISPECIES: SAM-dependent methyltransferase [Rhodobacterales]|uniref:SAM-dependent methyltransferase n=1 Tax=Ascidiaceihabitans sp. TaxID=1872644 RepID=UPI0032971D4D